MLFNKWKRSRRKWLFQQRSKFTKCCTLFRSACEKVLRPDLKCYSATRHTKRSCWINEVCLQGGLMPQMIPLVFLTAFPVRLEHTLNLGVEVQCMSALVDGSMLLGGSCCKNASIIVSMPFLLTLIQFELLNEPVLNKIVWEIPSPSCSLNFKSNSN